MQMNKWSYRADFAVYPLLIASALALALQPPRTGEPAHCLAALAAGWLAWTGIEYALHRWVLHRVPPFRRWHAAHHASPAAYIGTPTWLSAALFLAAWAGLTLALPRAAAAGVAAGAMIGYLVYAAIHDAVHHRRAAAGSWLHRAKLRHALHHRAGVHGPYGVSTLAWDHLFGTVPPRVR